MPCNIVQVIHRLPMPYKVRTLLLACSMHTCKADQGRKDIAYCHDS